MTIGTVLIPQSLAYAILCDMPAVYGLYSSLVPIFIYTLFASSRRLQVGPVALTSILIMVGIKERFPSISEPEYISLVLVSTLIIGVIQLLFSLLNLGFITRYISKPVMYGFISAAALIIISSQLTDMLGIYPSEKGSGFISFIKIFQDFNLRNHTTFAIGSISVLLLFIGKWKLKKIPMPLLLVIAGVALSYYLGLEYNHEVRVVGEIPRSFPQFTIPSVSWSDLQLLLPVCIVVTIINIAESVGMAKNMEALDPNQKLNVKQEIFAHGISKIIGSFFQSIPTSASFSRTAINQQLNSYSQLSSLVSMFMVVFSILFLTEILFHLPRVILASIILVSVIKLIQVKQLSELYKTHKPDMLVMLISFMATLILGIATGLLVGILASLLAILYKSGKPAIKVLGKMQDDDVFRDIEVNTDAQEIPKLLILRLDDQLYFGNADYFVDEVYKILSKRKLKPKYILLSMRNIHDLDSTGATALQHLKSNLQDRGISLVFSGAIYAVRKQLSKSRLLSLDNNFFMTTLEAYNYLK